MASKQMWGRRLSVVGGISVLAGCGGGDVSAGRESASFNLSRCYGAQTQCDGMQSTVIAESALQACDDAGTALADELRFPVASGNGWTQEQKVRLGADGSVWILRRLAQSANELPSTIDVVLEHYTADGTLLGNTEALATQTPDGHVSMSDDLSVSGAGHALVAIYTDYAPTADSPLDEALTLHEYDGDLHAVRDPLRFRGVGHSKVMGGSAATFALAGDALDNAAHGVLARVNDGAPDWIQTAVPSSGLGAGVGIAGLALDAAGVTSVLSQRNPHWEPGTPNQYSYGVARFDGNGNPLWDLVLPTAYAGGFSAALAPLVDGVVVVGLTDDGNSQLMRQVSSNGQLGWGFTMASSFSLPAVQVDAKSGRAIATATNGVAVVAPNGLRCKQYPMPHATGELEASADGLAVASPYLYLSVLGGEVRRYRLPEE